MASRRSRKPYSRRSRSSRGSRRSRRSYSRRSRMAKEPRSRRVTSQWSMYVKHNFPRIYKHFRGTRKNITRAEHRQYFKSTMKELKASFPGERKSRKHGGSRRSRSSRRHHTGSRKHYTHSASRLARCRYGVNDETGRCNKKPGRKSGSRRSRRSRSSKGSRKSRRSRRSRGSRRSRMVGVGASVLGVGAGVGVASRGSRRSRRFRRSRRGSRGSRLGSRAADTGAGIVGSVIGGAASLVTAPIRALVAPLSAAPARRSTRARAPRPLIPVLPAVGAERRVTRGMTAAQKKPKRR